MSRVFPVSLFLCLIILNYSCKRADDSTDTVSAHHVSYEVHYLDRMAGDIPTSILPGTLDAYYSRHYVCTIIIGFLNQFKLVQLADLRHRRVSTMLTFFGTEVYYQGSTGEIPAGIADPGAIELEFTGDTLRIGGLLSERISVSSDNDTFDIFSTEAFSSRRPNLCTPYHQVNDPLTRFNIKLSYLDMELICSTYAHEEVDAGLFRIPTTFKQVNRENMEDIINNLFTKE